MSNATKKVGSLIANDVSRGTLLSRIDLIERRPIRTLRVDIKFLPRSSLSLSFFLSSIVRGQLVAIDLPSC